MGESKPVQIATAASGVPCGPPRTADPDLSVDILCRCGLWREMLPDESPVERAVRAAVEVAAASRGPRLQISVLLTSDREVRDLNREWRGKDEPTNVLSFPVGPHGESPTQACPLGDIVLAAETVGREAADTDRAVAHHTAHLVVHGVLHLLGFDHEFEDDADRMEALEVRILESIGVADPYAEAADGATAR